MTNIPPELTKIADIRNTASNALRIARYVADELDTNDLTDSAANMMCVFIKGIIKYGQDNGVLCDAFETPITSKNALVLFEQNVDKYIKLCNEAESVFSEFRAALVAYNGEALPADDEEPVIDEAPADEEAPADDGPVDDEMPADDEVSADDEPADDEPADDEESVDDYETSIRLPNNNIIYIKWDAAIRGYVPTRGQGYCVYEGYT